MRPVLVLLLLQELLLLFPIVSQKQPLLQPVLIHQQEQSVSQPLQELLLRSALLPSISLWALLASLHLLVLQQLLVLILIINLLVLSMQSQRLLPLPVPQHTFPRQTMSLHLVSQQLLLPLPVLLLLSLLQVLINLLALFLHLPSLVLLLLQFTLPNNTNLQEIFYKSPRDYN